MSAKNLTCIRGNHEARFLTYWKLGITPGAKPYDLETFRQLESGFERYMRFVDPWPLYVLERQLLVVHAGFEPDKPLARQHATQLTQIRWLPGTDIPWYERYDGKRLVVFGHWAKRHPVLRPNAIGLDTGCVYGGSLSALILPERRIVSVAARKVYKEKRSWDSKPSETAWTPL